MDWMEHYRQRRQDAAKALGLLRSGTRIFLGSGCGEPRHLVRSLAEHAAKLADVEVIHVLSVAHDDYTDSRYAASFRPKKFFVAAGGRQAVQEGRADYVPLYLSDVPRLMREGRLTIDAALVQVAPPNEHGFVSLGVAVDVVSEAMQCARVVIAQVNPRMPCTHGDTFVHVSELDAIVEYDEPLIPFSTPEPDQVQRKVAQHVAKLIKDGSTIHCGLGRLPQAVLAELFDKKDLGVHTDVLTDAYVDLVEAGIITGEKKTYYPKKIVASYCLGGERLFSFVHNNPRVEMYPVRLTNDVANIAKNERMVTVHEAVEVDLTGQVCSDSVGGRVYAGLGGMVDFLRGAAQSVDGLSVVVLTSLRHDGQSRIRPTLSEGAGVGVTRAGVRTIVTEYGVAYLHGLSLSERAMALIDIAHPNHRDELLTAARELGLITSSQIQAPLFTGVYPEQYERLMTLKDGSQVLIRPVKPTDERLVQEFFYSMSDREVYYRFLHTIKAFPRKDMQRMVNVDYHREMPVVAVSGKLGQEEVAGVARYILGHEDQPEVDFAVKEGFQGKGLGRAMMGTLVEIAKGRGFTGLNAYVMPDNQASLRILYSLGYAVTGLVSQGVIEMTIHFDQPVSEPSVKLSYDLGGHGPEREEPLAAL
ncbi:MAG: GNAT family N-acetyltransferase [Desulfarculus sp.]|nr:GNAT family N-acetyltransferase [Desulfarculus sp.]